MQAAASDPGTASVGCLGPGGANSGGVAGREECGTASPPASVATSLLMVPVIVDAGESSRVDEQQRAEPCETDGIGAAARGLR